MITMADILQPEAIIPRLTGNTREEILQELANHMAEIYASTGLRAEDIYKLLWEREQLSSTAIGSGLAIPHARVPGLPKLFAALGISPKGVEYDASDAKPTSIFVVLLAPEGANRDHLSALARICRLFKGTPLSKKLAEQESSEEIYKTMLQQEGEL
ncbi:MAG: PTS sugar transporter subunit IIA [Myxococcales bacterium]|nr:PTS sugar transporter subunit IIA [Myxococcales bacterium]